MKNIIYKFWVSAILISFLSISCTKENKTAEMNLYYKLLSDKTWYLQYTQTINGTNITTKSYLGQTTYFINYLKDLTTIDSDGIQGTYSLDQSNNQLLINVVAKSPNGNASNYKYELISIGNSNMILSYNTGTILTKLYFSTKP